VATTLDRHGTPRLLAYAALTIAGLFGAVLSGRAELAALAAPFALILVAGVVLAEPVAVTARLEPDAERVLEGDAISGTVSMSTDVPVGRVDVLVPVAAATVEVPEGGMLAWSGSSAAMGAGLAWRLRADRWGLVRVGPVWARAHAPLGLIRFEGRVGDAATVRVLPGAATTGPLLRPESPRAAAGTHVARIRGDGLEFAEVRPYAPGDRFRTLNWAVSARRDGLWVNQRHPERSADLVLLVDTFSDDREGHSPALTRAVRAAWLLATAHLAAHDRVGLVTFGGYPAWLVPGGGERALLGICDRLLITQAAWTEAQRSVEFLPAHVISAGASVVGLTPLHDSRMVAALVDLRRRGMDVAAVEVDVRDLIADAAAARGVPPSAVALWQLERERRRDVLASVGVAVVPWPPGDEAAFVLDRLARLRRRSVVAP
jgi:uncharacterized protein (DUF58 family)